MTVVNRIKVTLAGCVLAQILIFCNFLQKSYGLQLKIYIYIYTVGQKSI